MKIKKILLPTIVIFILLISTFLVVCVFNHKHNIVIDEAVSPTCTKNGLTEGSHCSKCDEILTKQEIVSATGHSFVNDMCEFCGEAEHSNQSLDYVINDDGITCYISGIGTCSDLDIIIPEYIDGYKVTGIGNAAFHKKDNLTSIVIPNGVTSIGDDAFYWCRNLNSISIPNSVTYIGRSAFCGCNSLTNITIPDKVNSIGEWAFYGCTNLKNIVIPDVVTSIGDYMFYNCSSLTNITIPDSVTNIGYNAFYGCSSFTSIIISDSVISIDDSAFSSCKNLESIIAEKGNTIYHSTENCLIETASRTLVQACKNSTIPTDGSVTNIGNFAFSGCDSITNIVIPDTITSIGWGAFEECINLTNIFIPYSVTDIGNLVFSGCNNLESIIVEKGNPIYHSTENCLIRTANKTLTVGCKNSVIPNDGSVTRIGHHAFYNCNALTSIVIPDCITSIGDAAFYDCEGLTNIVIPDSVTEIDMDAFGCCPNLINVIIPDSITKISSGTFSNSNLTSIVIPNSVTNIEEYAFSHSHNLTNIVIPDSVTNISDGILWYCSSLVNIDFKGTKEQWNAISKGSDWDGYTGNYTVHCTDGDIVK